MKTLKLKVIGRVQGVFFRANTKNIADKLNIKGWVRNTPDGAVEIEAQGEECDLDELIKWCKAGPSEAMVDNVDIKWIEKSTEYQAFVISF